MRQFIILCSTLFFTVNLSAQIGINAGYRTNSADGWENFFEGQDFLNSGFKVGVDYWFRLKNRRIEFTPEISYTRFSSNLSSSNMLGQTVDQEFTAAFVGFDFHTNFYLLDFASDCDCPTWSKDGSIIDAGFFLQLSPGVAYGDFSATSTVNENQLTTDENSAAFKLGLGIGLDIGLNDAFTITPLITWQRYFGMEWKNLSTHVTNDVIPENADETSDLDQLFFGLKFQVRLDELRGY